MSSRTTFPKVLHMTTVPISLYFLENQLKFLQKSGFEVHVLSSPGEALTDVVGKENVIGHEVWIEREISIVQDLKSLWRVFRIIRNERFDIVHVHTPKAALIGMLAAKAAGVKVRIYHVHGLPYMTKVGAKRMLLQTIEKLTCSLASRVYTVSHSLRDFICENKLVNTEKASTIHNGSINGLDTTIKFNPASYSLSRHDLKLKESDRVLGFVGRIVRDKGIVELLEAWRVLKNRQEDLKLVIAGKMEEPSLTDSAYKEIENDPDILYVGECDNVAPYYSLMDVLVFPTYREGFGLVAIEAMAMGVPVIASNVLGCVDTIEDGKNGFLIEPRSVTGIVEKVAYYLDHPEIRTAHGASGQHLVRMKYDQHTIWNALLEDYKFFIQNEKRVVLSS
ncbi:glycosyltransferase family 4 protein [Thalassobacillus hwangdonensis]|uniref:Glycosyltransferase family 4 protein n=1 Tax=Thalassobacillus hwangdonensis TaxID=546108 RepID=A0ABW3L2P9_9BACI